MDNVMASQKHDVLWSCGISDCVVIGVFHKYNMKTGEYGERRMAHIAGGCLQEQSNQSLIKTLFGRLAEDASVVVAFGNNWSREFGKLTDYSGYVKKEAKKAGVAIPIAPDKWKCVYTGDLAFFGRGQSGSIKLFPNGKIASLNRNENH